MKREPVYLSVDGEGQVGTEPTVFDDAFVEAGAVTIQSTQDFADRRAGDFELRSPGAEVAQSGGDDDVGH